MARKKRLYADYPEALKRKHRDRARKRARADTLRRKFGITPDDYEALHCWQNGLCAICHKPETAIGRHGRARRLALDHCHTRLNIRGLLCYQCNSLLGLAHDDIARLQSAIAYLQYHDPT